MGSSMSGAITALMVMEAVPWPMVTGAKAGVVVRKRGVEEEGIVWVGAWAGAM
jgi:hypothetical protein